MLKTYLYIPDELAVQIENAAKEQKKSKAEVIRLAIAKSLSYKKKKYRGAEALLELAQMAKKHGIKGPKDLSINHDYYLWGGKKRSKI